MKQHWRGKVACLAGALAVCPLLAAPLCAARLAYTEPYLVGPAPSTGMYVCWLTREPAAGSYVQYGATAGFGQREPAVTHEMQGFRTVDALGKYTAPLKVYQQIVHLAKLTPGTRYYYRAVTVSGADSERTPGYDFKTAPRPGTPIKAVLLSDLQLMKGIPASVRIAGQQGADLIIYNGDMANVTYRAGEWFTLPGTPEEDGKRWFNVLQQTTGGARLLQYVPIYPSPGNHEVDDQEAVTVKALASRGRMSLSVYMQLFRPLYPEQGYRAGGKHWYSADYADLHIVSLSLLRWFAWPASEAPGWPIYDPIRQGSPQYEWLAADLRAAAGRGYIWVTQHWHMFNRSVDVKVPFTDPVPGQGDAAGTVTYPAGEDYLLRDVKPLYEKYGVNGVSFGHSHVYEHYRVNGISYIEAASIGNTYRNASDPPCSPNTGACPEFEETRFRSIMVVDIDPARGISARGIQTSVEPGGTGAVGRVFDTFTITDKPARK